MNMSIKLCLIGCAALPVAGCSGGSSAASGPTPPAEATLCELQFGRSTVAETIALLGQPTVDGTLADGSGYLDYQYPGMAAVADLHIDYDANEVLTDASTINITRPACWESVDGGADAQP